MSDIERCRTATLGGHVEQCDACGHQRVSFNSCRNRHCPKCQSMVRAQWLEDRQAEVLPVEYFHVVFNVPQEIAAIAYQNKWVVYDFLLRATAETLRTIAADRKHHLGAEIGFIAILRTWGQNLMHPPALALPGAWRRHLPRRPARDCTAPAAPSRARRERGGHLRCNACRRIRSPPRPSRTGPVIGSGRADQDAFSAGDPTPAPSTQIGYGTVTGRAYRLCQVSRRQSS